MKFFLPPQHGTGTHIEPARGAADAESVSEPFDGALNLGEIRTQAVTGRAAMRNPAPFTNIALKSLPFSAVDYDIAARLTLIKFTNGIDAGLAAHGEGTGIRVGK